MLLRATKRSRLSTAGSCLACLLAGEATGGIVTDGTMGPVVPPMSGQMFVDRDLGTLVGGNLFHSFTTFDVGPGESATFTATVPVTNVISRVTGGTPSEIYGAIRSQIPGADIWLINPSGLVFGDGAEIDVEGSFRAGTADEITFSDGGRFAADLTQPSGTVLTIANPAGFGFLQPGVGRISVSGTSIKPVTMKVGAGAALDLVGDFGPHPGTPGAPTGIGNATLTASGGRIRLASVASAGLVGLSDAEGGNLSLTGFDKLGALSITGSNLSAAGNGPEGAGSIAVAARALTISDSSELTVASTGGPAGTIDLNVASLDLQSFSHIRADTRGSGSGGSIRIEAVDSDLADGVIEGSVDISGFSGVTANTFGTGNAGLVSITAQSVSVSDAVVARLRSIEPLRVTFDYDFGVQASSDVRGADAGGAGRVEVTADKLTLESGSSCANACLKIIGGGGIAASSVDGAGGRIDLHVDELDVEFGGIIAVGSLGTGTGGAISVGGREPGSAAASVRLTGNGRIEPDSFLEDVLKENGKRPTGLLAAGQVGGDAGSISVKSDQVVVDNGAFIFGTGDGGEAGSIVIQATDLRLDRESLLSTSTTGDGNAGQIRISGIAAPDGTARAATSVVLDNFSQIYASAVGENATGDGGDVDIRSENLHLGFGSVISTNTESGSSDQRGGVVSLRVDQLLLQGAAVTALTQGAGAAGDVLIAGATGEAARSITLESEGQEPTDLLAVGISSASKESGAVDPGGGGAGGRVRIIADRIHVGAETEISADAIGGDTGSIVLSVRELLLEGEVIAATFGSGVGGDVTIQGVDGGGADVVTVTGPAAGILVGSFGSDGVQGGAGRAGNLNLAASDLVVEDRAGITAATVDGAGGTIDLRVDTLTVGSGSQISAATTGLGDAGDVRVSGLGEPGGRAGAVTIDNGELTSSSAGGGNAGSLTVLSEQLAILGGSETRAGLFSTSGQLGGSPSTAAALAAPIGAGNAGSILVDAGEVRIASGGQISVAALNDGDAGSAVIQGLGPPADDGNSLEVVDGGRVDAQATRGRAGNVLILTAGSGAGSVLLDAGQILAISADPLGQGSILIAGPGSSPEDKENSTTGPARLILKNGSTVSADSRNPSAGDAIINANVSVIDGSSTVRASGDVFIVGSVQGNPVEQPKAETLGASDRLMTQCSSGASTGRSTLVVRGGQPGLAAARGAALCGSP